jgi:hypothetical protein
MLAPNPWHEPERDELPDHDGAYTMIGWVILVIAMFAGALLTVVTLAVLR